VCAKGIEQSLALADSGSRLEAMAACIARICSGAERGLQVAGGMCGTGLVVPLRQHSSNGSKR
jgi:hypothetical protein